MERHTIYNFSHRNLLYSIALLVLCCTPAFLNAQFVRQKKADFFSESVKDSIVHVIPSRPSIESVEISMIDSNISFTNIVDKKDSCYFNWTRNTVFYNLSYAGDRFKLEQEVPALYRLIYNPMFTKEIIQHDSRPVHISFNAKHVDWDLITFGGGVPSPDMRREIKIEFTEKLNKNHRRRKIQTRDSVLILQAVISSEAILEGPMQLIKGQKDGLYDYFMKTYSEYEKQIAASALQKKMYRTYVSYMPVPRGLLEFFVRLNPDKTITFEVNGSGRVLRMKGIDQDLANTIITF